MRILIPTLCILLFIGCKKSGNKDKPDPPPVSSPALSMNVTEATPGDVVEIKVNKNSLEREVVIAFGGNTLKGYVKGDSAYVFFVPVVSPGALAVSIPSLSGSNTLSLKIKDYTPVSDPQAVISNFIDKRNKSIDSLSNALSVNVFQTSQATITLLSQLKEELDLQLARLSTSEKELLSYVLQKNMPDTAAFSLDLLAPSYYAKVSGLTGDLGDRLVATAKSYITVQTVCLGTIPIMVGSGAALLFAPNPFAAAVFIGAFTTFVIARESAIRRAQEVGRLKGVAEAIADADAQKVMAVAFNNNQEKAISLSVSFRNLASADAGINPNIAAAFTSELSFVNKDKELEGLYTKVKATSWFTKLSAAYTAYVAFIGKVPKATSTMPVDGNNIVIKGVSDDRISYTTSLSGTTRKVKITSTTNEQINFNLKLAYARTLDGKEITKDIACMFIAERTGVTVAGGGDWSTSTDHIDQPRGFCVDASGNIYVGEFQRCMVTKWAAGTHQRTVVAGREDCSAPNRIFGPWDVQLDGANNMYIIDRGGIITKWAPGASSGIAIAGKSRNFFVEASGNVYIKDSTGTIRKWLPGASSGVVVLSGLDTYSNYMFVDASGNIYISQDDRVIKWAPGASSGITVAGGNGRGAEANQFNIISGLFVDGYGNVYVSDQLNHRVQKWAPGASTGVTVAGGNGPGINANQVNNAMGVYVDSSGYIYVSDYYRGRIQRWPPY